MEKPEVHPHAENFRTQVCAMKPQQGLEPEEADRLIFLAKICKTDSKQNSHVLLIYNMSCLLCSMQIFTHLQR